MAEVETAMNEHLDFLEAHWQEETGRARAARAELPHSCPDDLGIRGLPLRASPGTVGGPRKPVEQQPAVVADGDRGEVDLSDEALLRRVPGEPDQRRRSTRRRRAPRSACACRPSWDQVRTRTAPRASRSRPAARRTVGQLGHERLPLVHGGHDAQAGEPPCASRGRERRGMTPIASPPAASTASETAPISRPGRRRRPARSQLRERGGERARSLGEHRSAPARGTAEDAHPFQGSSLPAPRTLDRRDGGRRAGRRTAVPGQALEAGAPGRPGRAPRQPAPRRRALPPVPASARAVLG